MIPSRTKKVASNQQIELLCQWLEKNQHAVDSLLVDKKNKTDTLKPFYELLKETAKKDKSYYCKGSLELPQFTTIVSHAQSIVREYYDKHPKESDFVNDGSISKAKRKTSIKPELPNKKVKTENENIQKMKQIEKEAAKTEQNLLLTLQHQQVPIQPIASVPIASAQIQAQTVSLSSQNIDTTGTIT